MSVLKPLEMVQTHVMQTLALIICDLTKLISVIINDNMKIHFPQLNTTRNVMSGRGAFLCWLRSASHNVMICYSFSCPDIAVVCYRLHQQSLLFSGGCKQLWEITEISFLLSPCLLEVLITECQQWCGRCSFTAMSLLCQSQFALWATITEDAQELACSFFLDARISK